MKILFVDILKKSYIYYSDLYRALCKNTEVTLHKTQFFNIKNIPNPKKIDAIIFGLGWMSQNEPKVYRKIKGLRKLGIPIICLLHKPQQQLNSKLNFCRQNADLLVYSQKEHKEYGKLAGIPSMQSWMAGDPKIYKDRGIEKIYDFGFSGALHGGNKIPGKTRNLRTRVQNIVKAKSGLNLFWNGSDSVAPRIKSVEKYAQTINQSKIWLTTTGPLEDISPRYFEIGLSKTLIFCNQMDHNTYGNVFRDGENCVMFRNDLKDFNKKLTHYLNADDERQVIVNNAYNEFISKHTWDHRAQSLIERIKKIK